MNTLPNHGVYHNCYTYATIKVPYILTYIFNF